MAGTILYPDFNAYPGLFLELNPVDLPVTTLLGMGGVQLLPQKEYTYTYHSNPSMTTVTPTLQTDLGTVNYGSAGFTTGSNVMNTWFEGAAVSWARQNDQSLGRTLGWQGPTNISYEADPMGRAISDALLRIKTQAEYVAREGVYFSNGAGTGTWQQRGYRRAPGISNFAANGAVGGGSGVGSYGTLTKSVLDDLFQQLYDNKINAGDELTLITNSRGKRQLSNIYGTIYSRIAVAQEVVNMFGINIERIVSDFGVINVVLTHSMPQDTMYALNLNQMRMVGHVAKGGQLIYESPTLPPGIAGDGVGLYTEMGVDHGHGSAHARLWGIGTASGALIGGAGTIESA